MTYQAETHGIVVQVDPVFLDEQSIPAENRFVWAYHIRIENRSAKVVQLLNRYWQITDAIGAVETVQGPGVVGKQPTLSPGEHFDYTSGAPLKTPSGIMQGRYEMTDRDGARFDVQIPAFSLDSPYQKIQLN